MLEQLRHHLDIDEEKWNNFIAQFNRSEIPAKTTLLQENAISNKLYLIEKGCMRARLDKNGKEVNVQFFLENETVAFVQSFFQGETLVYHCTKCKKSWWSNIVHSPMESASV